MICPIFKISVRKGKVVVDNPADYAVYISKLEGCRGELIIRKERKARSLNQNRYYFGVVVKILADFTGYTPEETHDALRMKFLVVHGVIDTIQSTTELSTVEFEEYMAKIRQWASVEYGVGIPEPNEVAIDDIV
jgi:hypothetical protein